MSFESTRRSGDRFSRVGYKPADSVSPQEGFMDSHKIEHRVISIDGESCEVRAWKSGKNTWTVLGAVRGEFLQRTFPGTSSTAFRKWERIALRHSDFP